MESDYFALQFYFNLLKLQLNLLSQGNHTFYVEQIQDSSQIHPEELACDDLLAGKGDEC